MRGKLRPHRSSTSSQLLVGTLCPSRRIVLLGSLWALFSLSPDADAAEAVTTDRCQADVSCRERVAAATQLAAQLHYEDALRLYVRAYEQSQEPRLLLNIGRCHYRLNNHSVALDFYERFRQAQPNPEPELASRLAQFVAEAKLALLSQKPAATAGQGATAPRSGQPGEGGDAARPGSPASPTPSPIGSTGSTGSTDSAAAQAAPAAPASPHAASPTEPRQSDSRGATVWGRPAWRAGLGLGAAGVGAALVGLGIGALSAHGRCVTPAPFDADRCVSEVADDGQRRFAVLDGVTPGVPLLVSGGLLLVGGLVLVTLPARARPRLARLAQ